MAALITRALAVSSTPMISVGGISVCRNECSQCDQRRPSLARWLRAGDVRRDGDAEPVSEGLVASGFQFLFGLAAVFAEDLGDFFVFGIIDRKI